MDCFVSPIYDAQTGERKVIKVLDEDFVIFNQTDTSAAVAQIKRSRTFI